MPGVQPSCNCVSVAAWFCVHMVCINCLKHQRKLLHHAGYSYDMVEVLQHPLANIVHHAKLHLPYCRCIILHTCMSNTAFAMIFSVYFAQDR